MPSTITKLRDLLSLAQEVLDGIPVGLLVLSAKGTVLWFNREGEIVCSVWNGTPLRRDSLPLNHSKFIVPAVLWAECERLLALDEPSATAGPCLVEDKARGLYASIRLQPRPGRHGPPACFIQLDYRRPRGDRDRPLSPNALSLMARLSFREREVAVRLRDGLSTAEIAKELNRSKLTIKTQLAGVYQKLGVNSRAKVAAFLNRRSPRDRLF